MTSERFSLKDHLFNREKVAYLGRLFADAVPRFDDAAFERSIMERLADLELKQRIALIAGVLSDHLDTDFTVAADQIRSALPPPLDPSLGDGDFGDFIFAPLGKYVEDQGSGHIEIAMPLLRELTMRFSMEGSVRPFLAQSPEQTLRLFGEWARDDNYHVRRVVSESTRPRLPWAPRIPIPVADPIPLLDILHADPTRYVTRSVANHLNDIAKVDPGMAMETLARWHDWARQAPRELEWMTRHALRTLMKRGDAKAMALLGYSPDPNVDAGPVEISTPTVVAGESLRFSVRITARDDQKVTVAYAIDFMKRDGRRSTRVFKLKNLLLAGGETVTLSKSHPLRADASTYALYPGEHGITIIVNGKAMGRGARFDVSTG